MTSLLFNKSHISRDFTHTSLLRPAARLFVARLTIFMLVVLCLQVNASSFSQGITLWERETPFESVLIKIRDQSGYRLLYNTELIRQAKPVTIEVFNTPIEDVLKICFKEQKGVMTQLLLCSKHSTI